MHLGFLSICSVLQYVSYRKFHVAVVGWGRMPTTNATLALLAGHRSASFYPCAWTWEFHTTPWHNCYNFEDGQLPYPNRVYKVFSRSKLASCVTSIARRACSRQLTVIQRIFLTLQTMKMNWTASTRRLFSSALTCIQKKFSKVGVDYCRRRSFIM